MKIPNIGNPINSSININISLMMSKYRMKCSYTRIFLDIRSLVPLSFGSNPITLSQIQMTIEKDNFVQNALPPSPLSYTIMTFSFPPNPFPAKPTHASTVLYTITQHPRIYICVLHLTLPKFQIEPLSLSLSLSQALSFDSPMASSQKLTEYERKRLENIRRNDEMMAALKIHSKATELSASSSAKRQRSLSLSLSLNFTFNENPSL